MNFTTIMAGSFVTIQLGFVVEDSNIQNTPFPVPTYQNQYRI